MHSHDGTAYKEGTKEQRAEVQDEMIMLQVGTEFCHLHKLFCDHVGAAGARILSSSSPVAGQETGAGAILRGLSSPGSLGSLSSSSLPMSAAGSLPVVSMPCYVLQPGCRPASLFAAGWDGSGCLQTALSSAASMGSARTATDADDFAVPCDANLAPVPESGSAQRSPADDALALDRVQNIAGVVLASKTNHRNSSGPSSENSSAWHDPAGVVHAWEQAPAPDLQQLIEVAGCASSDDGPDSPA